MKTALYLAIYQLEEESPCYCCGAISHRFIAERLPKGTDTVIEHFQAQEVLEADIPEDADGWALKTLEAVYEIEETLLLSQNEAPPIRRYLPCDPNLRLQL